MLLLLCFVIFTVLCQTSGHQSLNTDDSTTGTGGSQANDIFERNFVFPVRDVRDELRVGVDFIPVIGFSANFSSIRAAMFAQGLYPGVDYTVESITTRSPDHTTVSSTVGSSTSTGECSIQQLLLNVRPAYPLIPQLERDWPVQVPLSSIPRALTKGMYNALTASVAASGAALLLLSVLLLSQLFTLSAVNSRSMQPTIEPRDLILVQKSLFPLSIPVAVGDIIFFREPPQLHAFIEKQQLPPLKAGDLLVKRVSRVQQQLTTTADSSSETSSSSSGDSRSCLEVRGDNAAVSVDSRQFGCLPRSSVVGKPLLRVWPPARFGALK